MFEKIQHEIDNQCAPAEQFCDNLYESIFAPTFTEVQNLHARMKSERVPITDDELTYILTELPLDLFSVSESLNKLRLKLEVTKLENNKREVEYKRTLNKELLNSGEKSSILSQIVKDELVTSMTEYRVMEMCYSSIISRVENQLTYSRELIMGAKKIWDSRRAAESSNPINPMGTNDLPPYQM